MDFPLSWSVRLYEAGEIKGGSGRESRKRWIGGEVSHQRTGYGTMAVMRATVELPDPVLQQLEALARLEGATSGDLIRRIVEDHVARSQPPAQPFFNVSLPLVGVSETGPIRPVTGADVDLLLSDDRLSA